MKSKQITILINFLGKSHYNSYITIHLFPIKNSNNKCHHYNITIVKKLYQDNKNIINNNNNNNNIINTNTNQNNNKPHTINQTKQSLFIKYVI